MTLETKDYVDMPSTRRLSIPSRSYGKIAAYCNERGMTVEDFVEAAVNYAMAAGAETRTTLTFKRRKAVAETEPTADL